MQAYVRLDLPPHAILRLWSKFEALRGASIRPQSAYMANIQIICPLSRHKCPLFWSVKAAVSPRSTHNLSLILPVS